MDWGWGRKFDDTVVGRREKPLFKIGTNIFFETIYSMDFL